MEKCTCGSCNINIENPNLTVNKKFLCDICKNKYMKNYKRCIYKYYAGDSDIHCLCEQKVYKDNLCYNCYHEYTVK